MKKSSILELAKIIILSVVFTLISQYAIAAWLQPSYLPTADCPRNDPTCVVPINTTAERQIKSGEFVSGYLTGQWLLVGLPQGTNPNARADVGGAIRIWDNTASDSERITCGTVSASNPNGNAGVIRYKRSTNVLQYCNGTNWKDL